ncbi:MULTISPECIES: hypothetical protein [unclassified Streptomyces]|uniref:hypothetical protein n=1 Tax=Streptomyces TaxID=1883 RepID=UPI00081B60A1|nr:hypothetical protein [Streptomyces sp. BvitLS-983]MYX88389.1 hypothetical protein [Streptomyces sp. SID4915]SCE16302.1 hypothetical protein GA0115250_144717 [Streptomyces sp. BvitLS-983]
MDANPHRLVDVHTNRKDCTECGIVVTQHSRAGSRYASAYQVKRWITWAAPDGRRWETYPDGNFPDAVPPSCPPPGVEALCPWRPDAMQYRGAKGRVQHETAKRTWCDTHQCAVNDCPEPGPLCYGAFHHNLNGDGTRTAGRCTGRQDSCRCMCPSCCGDTPDMYGYDGPF